MSRRDEASASPPGLELLYAHGLQRGAKSYSTMMLGTGRPKELMFYDGEIKPDDITNCPKCANRNFLQRLGDTAWTDGKNVLEKHWQIDYEYPPHSIGLPLRCADANYLDILFRKSQRARRRVSIVTFQTSDLLAAWTEGELLMVRVRKFKIRSLTEELRFEPNSRFYQLFLNESFQPSLHSILDSLQLNHHDAFPRLMATALQRYFTND